MFTSSPNDKISEWFKFKALADDTINVTEKLKFVLGKGENAGFQHFLLFPKCFQKASSSSLFKVEIVWQRVKHIYLTSIEKEVLTD